VEDWHLGVRVLEAIEDHHTC